MKLKTFSLLFVFMIGGVNQEKIEVPKYHEENVTYKSDGTQLKGFLVYDENMKEKRPAVLVVPEWWGLNDYAKSRARQLAALGYIAMAVDIFGEGKTASNPHEAQSLTEPFYKHPEMENERLKAAINKIKEYRQSDVKNIAAIGYCFGGSVVLNSANLGTPLKGIVCFHGTLTGIIPQKKILNTKILICHGADDKFNPPAEVQKFRHLMDSLGADYTFKIYPKASHSFTNPNATALGKQFNIPIAYNPEADRDSWNDMKKFFKEIFKQ